MKATVTITPSVNPCQKPSGLLGRFVLWNMNARHSKVTDWGLAGVEIPKRGTSLDVGCGGGRTVSKLAERASEGKVCGIDYAPAAVKFATKTNKRWVEMGRVTILEGSVSSLPFPDDMFDLVTAVETHFWWPDLAHDFREVLRVMKPGGTLVVVAEVYRDADTKLARMVEKHLPKTGMKLLTVDQHREMLAQAGYSDVQITTDAAHGWIRAIGKKSAAQSAAHL